MKRAPNVKDFSLNVEGIGTFRFAARTMRSEIAIAAEFSRLTEGVAEPSVWLEFIAGVIAALKVLIIEAPEGWSIDDMDPLDQQNYDELVGVHKALREKEDSFRGEPKPRVEEKGPEAQPVA